MRFTCTSVEEKSLGFKTIFLDNLSFVEINKWISSIQKEKECLYFDYYTYNTKTRQTHKYKS